MREPGLSAGDLKWIALAAMTLDHIGLWAEALGAPLPLLRAVGRMAAPLFLFVLTESLRRTRSRPRLLGRLALGGLCHAAVSTVLIRLTGAAFWYGNIFFSFLYVGLLVTAAEGAARRDWKPAALLLLTGAAGWALSGSGTLSRFLPALWDADYSALFLLLGAAFYALDDPKKAAALLAVLSAASAAVPADAGFVTALRLTPMFTGEQWCMALASPLLLCYNGTRGNGGGPFFYFYYPIHQYVLLFAAALIKNA